MPGNSTQRAVNGVGRPSPGGVGVALVDGVPLFREGLSALVHRTPGLRWLGATDTPTGALQFSERFHPHVVLIDSGLDPRNHLSHLLTTGDPDVAVLILVREQHRTTQYLASTVASGVHGIILRSVEAPQLLEAIRAVQVERRYIDPSLAQAVAPPTGRMATMTDAQQPLSRREYQVLQLIADGLENQAIAKILYVSVETVRTHVKSILRKLSARDRTHAVAVAFRSGVLVVPPNRAGVPPDHRTTAPRTGT